MGRRALKHVAGPACTVAGQGHRPGQVAQAQQHIVRLHDSCQPVVVGPVAANAQPVVRRIFMMPELAAQVGQAEIFTAGLGQQGKHCPVAAGVFFFRQAATAAGGGNFRYAQLCRQINSAFRDLKKVSTAELS